MPLTLADFAGTWRFRRHVAGPQGQTAARVAGLARFSRDAEGLVCDESGEMSVPGAAPMRAGRRTLWNIEPGQIVIRFADGRPFHSFDPAAARPAASHECAPDLYRVAYDFSLWPHWQSIWRVTGPRKDYLMTTDYSR